MSRGFHHADHLRSIAVVTSEAGAVVERLSYDAWGQRRHPDGTPDPSGSITSQSSHGFTGHEHLADVGLIHMNGRVYDPLLARFGTPDPMTEDPFSTQGWNRYSYVGNSPLNFTDPTGYCFMGCFWKPVFKAIGQFLQKNFAAILQVAATALCTGPAAPICAGVIAFGVTGVTSGNLGLALRAGFTASFTAAAMYAVGTATTGHKIPEFMSSAHVANMAGHALVGCASAVMGGGKCGPGAFSGAVGSFAGPILKDLGFQRNLVAHAVVGGLASVAAGGNFANGAVTAAFGYLFNYAQTAVVAGSGLGALIAGPAAFFGALFYPSDTGVDPMDIVHRGRIQVQNSPGGTLEESWAWARTREQGPPTRAEALAALYDLRDDLSRSDLRNVDQAFVKAEKFINQQAARGG